MAQANAFLHAVIDHTSRVLLRTAENEFVEDEPGPEGFGPTHIVRRAATGDKALGCGVREMTAAEIGARGHAFATSWRLAGGPWGRAGVA